ncbi:SNF2-related protein [Levilactobacillus namurensis]|uniref:SNF2-related protein n=1 Tax=Levilactobacillus namurensis TaxID=380393 RepID=UPI0022316FE3|nr:SNF2-related protein [Levilactobacillus namurensis]MCW3777728.1 SNF2-related protein [Levilactobacillus namurensis]MDT7019109.1 SNF2-related protein [Levilactobacillus namurensis]WNN66285.1 SNF2-related protein [Levilactobacillus namurensis]
MFYDIRKSVKSTYTSTETNISETFYNPILAESIAYDRVSGYFSSKGLAQYAVGLDQLADNGGRARFIISADISEDDFNSIQKGYRLKSERERLSENDEVRLGNLAYMIAQGHVEIKFGLMQNGLFHSKWGLFQDEAGEQIYFNGSNNETQNAMENNYESFDVDVSWDESQNVRSRIAAKQKAFEELWMNRTNGVEVREATNIVYKEIKNYDQHKIQRPVVTTDGSIILEMSEDKESFVLKDYSHQDVLKNSMVRRKAEVYQDPDKGYPFLAKTFNYRELDKGIRKIQRGISRVSDVPLVISDEVKDYLSRERYSIEEYRKAGLTAKNNDERWRDDYLQFQKVVSQEVSRPLKDLQMKSAFYMYNQKRAANFSVPGSGKTTMLLGVFAFLNQGSNPKVDRILVVSPINAFTSWRDEFETVFNGKKKLVSFGAQDSDASPLRLKAKWYDANLVLINYESLPKYGDALAELLKQDGKKTMLVFDEVHRIKGIGSVRAQQALELTDFVDYKYVLTGTPIPNGYQDSWNFLHLLFGNEYSTYFNFSKPMLSNPSKFDIQEINKKLFPFFWRTSKDDLGVPPANQDSIIEVAPSPEQLKAADFIYTHEKSQLAVLIRLLQLSTNPQLLTKAISYADLGFSDEDVPGEDNYEQASSELSYKIKQEIQRSQLTELADLNIDKIKSPKFDAGIKLVKDLVQNNKRVVVWGLFVDTLNKISETLEQAGIKTALVYGATPKDERERLLADFKKEDSSIQVLVSNPNTLGESVSLHKVVHDAVYFEYNYNLTFMLQSRDRIHRLGLKPEDQTNYYYLMTVSNNPYHNFIDKKVYEALGDKEKRMKNAIDKQVLVPEFSDDAFDEMKKIIDDEKP